MIVSGEDVARFISDGLGFGLFPPYTAIGIATDGEIRAGMLFNCFEGRDVHMSAYGHGWTKGFLAEVGRYVYHQLDCERMTLLTEQGTVVEMGRRLGGKVEGVMRNHFGPGRDATVIGILKDEWKYWPRAMLLQEAAE